MSEATNPIGSARFREQLTSSPEPVVVDFTAAWCAPCRRLTPLLADLAERYRGRVRVITVDVEARPDIAQAYRVTSMPTLLAFRGTDVVAQQVGYGSRAPVEALFERLAAMPGLSAGAP